MKIAEADLLMNSSRAYMERDEEKESLRVWAGRSPDTDNARTDQVDISRKAESLFKEQEVRSDTALMDEYAGEEISLRKLIAELLSGREVKSVRIDEKPGRDPNASSRQHEETVQENRRQGWGLEYDYEQTHHEKEEVDFKARGIIKTADGKEIGFTLSLGMSREYVERNSISIRAGDAAVVDPLVINFDGSAANLSDMRFSFDLDSDGALENVPVPASGRGFLALDKDDDGIIGNGSELFGPSTGNGFSELCAYDADRNSWIDENDEVFARLRIMTIDGTGKAVLHTLKDTGVGAIYLGNISTRFDLRRTATDDALLGQVRATGIYLKEDGTPGTIQQLDLVA